MLVHSYYTFTYCIVYIYIIRVYITKDTEADWELEYIYVINYHIYILYYIIYCLYDLYFIAM